MKIRHLTRTLFLSTFAFLCLLQTAQAGLIIGDKEWMLRGTEGDYASHQAESALDTGWTWATLADLSGSPLLAAGLSQADFEAFAPPSMCGFLSGFGCDAWLADTVFVDPFGVSQSFIIADLATAGFSSFSASSAEFVVSTAGVGSEVFRVSFRAVGTPVPEPTTFSLLGLALAGLGWRRQKRA